MHINIYVVYTRLKKKFYSDSLDFLNFLIEPILRNLKSGSYIILSESRFLCLYVYVIYFVYS